MFTTLNKIISNDNFYNENKEKWGELLKNLGKTEPDDEPLSLSTILESSGIDVALWCLSCIDGYDREIRLLAVEFARGVQHLVKDQTIISALDIVEKYANGLASEQELNSAQSDAKNASIAAKAASADSFAAMSISHTALSNARDAAYYTAWAALNAVATAEDERQSHLLKSSCAEK